MKHNRNSTNQDRVDLIAVYKTRAPVNLVRDMAYRKTALAEVERPRRAARFTLRQEQRPV